MKRSQKLILLLSVLAVVSGAALYAIRLDPDSAAGAVPGEGINIFSLDIDSVSGLSWDCDGEIIAFVNSEKGWVYDADSTFPLDESYLETMLTELIGIRAEKTIEGVETLSDYGLETPCCTITVTAGATHRILVGDESGLGGQRYLTTGDENVYLVDSCVLDYFPCSLYDLIKKEEIPIMMDLESVNIEAGSRGILIEYLEGSGLARSDEYTWFMKEGEAYLTLDTALTGEFVRQITDLAWGGCVNYRADAAALREYGLDAPAATVTVNYRKSCQAKGDAADDNGDIPGEGRFAFVLDIGDFCGDSCYARIKDSGMVYLIDASIGDALLHTTYDDLRPDEVLSMDWDRVIGIDIILEGRKYHLKKELQKTGEEDGDIVEGHLYTLDGKAVEIADLLVDLTSLASTGYGDSSLKQEIQIGFVFHRDAVLFPEVELNFYRYSSASCLAVLNGEPGLLVPRDDLVSLVETAELLLN